MPVGDGEALVMRTGTTASPLCRRSTRFSKWLLYVMSFNPTTTRVFGPAVTITCSVHIEEFIKKALLLGSKYEKDSSKLGEGQR